LVEDKDEEEEGEPVADEVRRARRVSMVAARERPSWCCKRCISACTACRKVRVWVRARASVRNKEEEVLLMLVLVCACSFPPSPPLLSMICVVLNGVMMMRGEG